MNDIQSTTSSAETQAHGEQVPDQKRVTALRELLRGSTPEELRLAARQLSVQEGGERWHTLMAFAHQDCVRLKVKPGTTLRVRCLLRPQREKDARVRELQFTTSTEVLLTAIDLAWVSGQLNEVFGQQGPGIADNLIGASIWRVSGTSSAKLTEVWNPGVRGGLH